jgi:hypothetical protein
MEDRVRSLERDMGQVKKIFIQQNKIIKDHEDQLNLMERVLTRFQREMKDIVEDGFDEIKERLDKKHERQEDFCRDQSKDIYHTFLPKSVIFWILGVCLVIFSSAVGANWGYTYMVHSKVAGLERRFEVHEATITHRHEELHKKLPVLIPPGS